MRKVHSAPFCIGAGQRRGILSGLLQKWKREVFIGRAGNRSHIAVPHHMQGPTPPPANLPWWVMFCTAPLGLQAGAGAVTVGRSGTHQGREQGWPSEPVMTNEQGLRSVSCSRTSSAAIRAQQAVPTLVWLPHCLLFSDIVLLLGLGEK